MIMDDETMWVSLSDYDMGQIEAALGSAGLSHVAAKIIRKARPTRVFELKERKDWRDALPEAKKCQV